jgi:hypothetical protein
MSVKMATATKMAKEEIVNELSRGTLSRYKTKASNQAGSLNKMSVRQKDNRYSGIKRASDKMKVKEAKDPNEYDKEGEMMKNQLRQICSANEKLMSMVQDDDNLPEWVQSKVTKATDYIRSVRDYLEAEKEGDQELDEKKPRMENIQSLRKRAKDLLEASYSDRSKVKDFSKEKSPVETIVKTITKDNAVKSFINKRPRFDRALYMDGDDLVLGDSLVMTVKDNTTISDIKKAILKVK